MPWTFYTSAGVAKTGEYLGSEFPVGTITQTAATAAGTGWLFCDGSSLVRATYPELFTAIGVTYGSVSGSTFTLPDLRGRVPVGAGAGSGLTARVLGVPGGVETTPNVVPAHDHTMSATTGTESADHSHSGTTGGHSNDHTHYYERSQDFYIGLGGGTATTNWQVNRVGANTGGASSNHTHNFGTGGRSAAHTHSFSGTTGSTGTGGAIPIVQPFVAINFMIYAVTYARRAG